MAALPNKNINPVLAAVANFCCCSILGYILLGQVRKGLFPLLTMIVLGVAGGAIAAIFGYMGSVIGLLGLVVYLVVGVINLALGIFVVIDAYQVAEAVKNGAEVDENEYKFELLYKVMSNIDKQAIYKG